MKSKKPSLYDAQEEQIQLQSASFVDFLTRKGVLEDHNIDNERVRKAKKDTAQRAYHNTEVLLSQYRLIIWVLECIPGELSDELEVPVHDIDALAEKIDIQTSLENARIESRVNAMMKTRYLVDRIHEALGCLIFGLIDCCEKARRVRENQFIRKFHIRDNENVLCIPLRLKKSNQMVFVFIQNHDFVSCFILQKRNLCRGIRLPVGFGIDLLNELEQYPDGGNHSLLWLAVLIDCQIFTIFYGGNPAGMLHVLNKPVDRALRPVVEQSTNLQPTQRPVLTEPP